jgi:hypothetical protein
MAHLIVCGAECGPTVGTAHHWDGSGGTLPVIETSVVRTGSRSFLIDNASGYLSQTTTTAPNVAVARFYFRVAEFADSGDSHLIQARSPTGTAVGSVRINSSGQLFTEAGSGAGSDSGTLTSAISLDTWYRLDAKFDFTGGATTDAKLDGVDLDQAFDGGSTLELRTFRVGVESSTIKIYYDDIVLTEGDAGDYPINAGNVRAYSPDADGTHSFTTGDFKYTDTSNIATSATDVYTYVDEVPLTSNTDYVYQAVVNGGGYLEVAMPTTGLTNSIRAVDAVVRFQTSSGSDANATWRIREGGSETTIFSGTISASSGNLLHKVMASKPSGGDWTNATLGASTVRYGYSSDISPQPRWQSLLLEVDFRDTVEASGVRSFAVMVG